MAEAFSARERGPASATDRGVAGAACCAGAARGMPQHSPARSTGLSRSTLVFKVGHLQGGGDHNYYEAPSSYSIFFFFSLTLSIIFTFFFLFFLFFSPRSRRNSGPGSLSRLLLPPHPPPWHAPSVLSREDFGPVPPPLVLLASNCAYPHAATGCL